MMSNNTTPSTETLPVEIFHRIFDNLDAETILLSIRSVCRLFRSVVNTYNSYILNFKLMAKPNFVVLCRLINPENIISLTLSNSRRTPKQIDLFVSLISLSKLTRLRSLTFVNINQSQLNTILKQTDLTNLTSFSYDIEDDDISRMSPAINLIPLLTEKFNLPKLEFEPDNKGLSNISRPMNCALQRLMINDYVTIDHLREILRCCSYLHTLIVKSVYGRMSDDLISTSFHQLKSLTIERFDGSIDLLESFLLSTPSLVYLKLIDRRMLDGKRWEEFTRIHLPKLDKFEFYLKEYTSADKTDADIKLIIASFRAPFWLEQKKWFVTCEYDGNGYIYLYSIPKCTSDLTYDITRKNISLSTQPMTLQNDPTINNNIKSLKLSLQQPLADHIKEKIQSTTATHPLYPKVTEIHAEIFREEYLCLLKSLSILIDFSKIVQLTWYASYSNNNIQQILLYLKTFLEQTYNLSSLLLSSHRFPSFKVIDNLCSTIPRHVRHLQMPVNKVHQIKTIIERCENLSTVELKIEHPAFSEEVFKWFDDNTINSTCSTTYRRIDVWVGKRNIQ